MMKKPRAPKNLNFRQIFFIGFFVAVTVAAVFASGCGNQAPNTVTGVLLQGGVQ